MTGAVLALLKAQEAQHHAVTQFPRVMSGHGAAVGMASQCVRTPTEQAHDG
jgi:hypothetical protein